MKEKLDYFLYGGNYSIEDNIDYRNEYYFIGLFSCVDEAIIVAEKLQLKWFSVYLNDNIIPVSYSRKF
jgi:hypothetical protein